MGLTNSIVPGFEDEVDDCLTIEAKKIADINDCCSLKLTGYIDTYNSSFFQKKTEILLNGGYKNFLMDCADLNYISSTGIGSLATFLRATQNKGGHLVLLTLQPNVLEVFMILGFTQFFTVKDTEAEALEYLKSTIQ